MITPRRCHRSCSSASPALSPRSMPRAERSVLRRHRGAASCSPKTRPGSLQVSVECEAERRAAAKASMRSARHVQVRVDPLPAREGAQGKTRHYVVTLSYL